ncbi:hypothetical protein [Paenibacillus piscarius]|uniref:hypothetical protein n=1 Tax=Paenibacillus piscarius TaxID=1089681 RepID=UPI001EE8817A|nr:hypothetical protein [Paenibacillus piscarius]
MNVNNQDVACLAAFLFPGPAGGPKIDSLIRAAPGALRICRLRFDEGDVLQDVCMQVLEDRTIITGMQDEDAFGYELNLPEETIGTCEYLFNCPGQPRARTIPVPALFLSRRRFEEIRDRAEGWTLCVLAESLGAETGDPASSARLAGSMKAQTASGELRLCSREGESWNFQQASFIEAETGSWLLRSSCEPGDDYMIAFPLTRAELCHAFVEWLINAAPIKEGD